MTAFGLDAPGERFSLVVGGPFHAALQRLGLTDADQLPSGRAAIGAALLAWLAPALLAIVQTFVDRSYTGWGFFSDWMVYTRYLVAIWIMIATERYADGRLFALAHHFREAQLLSEDDLPAFDAAIEAADRRSGSALAELIIAVAALVWSGVTAGFTVLLAGTSWEGSVVGGEAVLSWAGEAVRLLSTPFFLFLLARWLWRFLVWTVLLYRIARLPLQLMPLHPDRSAGLGFLAIYPTIFSGFIFAQSCVVASSMLKDLSLEHHSAQTVWFALAGWLAVCLCLGVGPLLVFIRPLYDVRERALLEYGRLVNQHHSAFHRKWVANRRNGKELLGSADVSSASDLNATVETAQDMRLIPVDAVAVKQILVAAGLPMLAVVLRQVPLAELVH